MNSSRVALIGGGGHARVLTETLVSLDLAVQIVVAPKSESNSSSETVVFASDQNFIERFGPDEVVLVNAVGSLPRDSELRKRLYYWYSEKKYVFLTIVSPLAYVSPSAVLGPGVQVNAGAIIQAGARLGENCIVNTGAIIEHDCVLGDHCHVAPGAVLSGGVTLGASAHVGTGAKLIQGLEIGRYSVIGAGAVVTNDVPSGTTFVSRESLAVRASYE